MANAKLVPEGPPPKLGYIDGPANSWIPTAEDEDLEDGGLANTTFGHLAGKAQIDIRRVADKGGVGALMGKVFRNPVTGSVQIRKTGTFPDFCVVDLWTRPEINGTIDQLCKDPYLFRPTPLNLRTWMYHHNFRDGKVFSKGDVSDEDAMIRSVLEMKCIDVDGIIGGKFASVVFFVPMMLFLTLAADISSVIVGVVMLAVMIAIYWLFNSPELYRHTRIVTLPMRFIFLIYILVRMGAKSEAGTQTALSSLGFIFAFFMAFAEIAVGDCGAICAYRLHCDYEVIKPLPNRIFVCKRHGAAHSQEIFGNSLPISEKITGIGGWQREMVLLADIKGLIMELRPMSKQDWGLIFNEKQMDESVIHRFIGLDIFCPGSSNIDSLMSAIHEQRMLEERSKTLKLEDA